MAKRIPLAKRTPKKRTGKEHDPNSDRAIRFCELYVAGDGTGSGAMNGALAAEQAGYAKRSAKQTAYILLGLAPVQERIQALMDERSERTQITADYVLTTIKQTVERCLQRAPVMVRRGKETVQLQDEEGRDVWQFDASNVLRGCELLGRHLKLFTDKVEHSGKIGLEALIAESMETPA